MTLNKIRLNHIKYRIRQIDRSLAEVTRKLADIENSYGPLANRDCMTKSDRFHYQDLEAIADQLCKEYEQLKQEEKAQC